MFKYMYLHGISYFCVLMTCLNCSRDWFMVRFTGLLCEDGMTCTVYVSQQQNFFSTLDYLYDAHLRFYMCLWQWWDLILGKMSGGCGCVCTYAWIFCFCYCNIFYLFTFFVYFYLSTLQNGCCVFRILCIVIL
jgi:hypothetical protein